ncbi:hypothetical protein B1A99_28255 [Cohnella sp. CIP 111063]|uniref:InlB B-repeat-containing protein n=1 Tax=unclassified Cohnella TaxID=2636738 RepID=UPI000B8C56AC|nr:MULTISPECIES: InlB B-repeat-containing protein [unclassified Cohnella]OXS53798.1 hypothetical protein B1A99_28255 [Cohnella sp. CIP 111063]PRX62374.1 putative repeat protein (TIGR02543 family) [Cohnella sp. SGD-V74]
MKVCARKAIVFLLAAIVAFGGLPILPGSGGGRAYAASDGKWETVGNAGFSGGQASYSDLFIADDGTPYLAYSDGQNSYKATVMKFSGGSWAPVGNVGFSAGSVSGIHLQVDNGIPYIAYTDSGQANKIVVMKYDGTSWTTVGGGPVSAGGSNYMSMYVYNGVPYVAYQDQASFFKGTMKKFNGSGWDTVGGFFTGTQVNSLSLYVDNGTPYVGYQLTLSNNKATVIRLNASDAWETVGSGQFSAGQTDYLSLYVDAGTPYLAYRDSGNGNRATVMKYDGGWQALGGAGFSATSAMYLSLIVYGGVPYVAFADNNYGITVMKYAGTAWEWIGGAAAGSGGTPSLQVYGGTPYVGYQDYGASSKATVKKWMRTVAYDGNGSAGGSVPAAATGYDKNAVVTVLGNSGGLQKPGHSFAGWNTAADGSGTAYGAGATFAMGENSVTLYAQWTINSYAVAYEGNGSTYGAVPAGSSQAYGSTVTVQGNPGGLAKTGHTFAGWNTAPDGSGTAYGEGATFAMGEDAVTLYAQWTANDYPVSYDGNGSTGGNAPAGGNYVYGSSITVQGNPGGLVKTGHTFAGWNTAADGSGTNYAPAASLTIGPAGVILYARWTIDSYAVAYDGNGSTSGSAPAGNSYNYGSIVTVQGNSGSLARTGHTFAGWNTAADGSGTNYAPGASLTIGTSNVTLYAQWTANSYTVSFESNGGTPVNDQTIVYGQTVASPNVPTRTGYTFAGWHSDSSLQTPYSFAAPIGAANMTLYAKWTINSYPVAYDGNGHTGGAVPAGSSHDYGSGVTVQGNSGGLAKTGHTFAGWNTKADGSGTVYAAGDSLTIGTEGVTLYAQWSVNDYEVSYDDNGSDGGTVPAGGTFPYGTNVTVNANSGGLVKTGHTFAGWNTKADGSGAGYAAADVFSLGAEDVTLFAQWTANSYTVSFESNGGTEVTEQSVVFAQPVVEPAEPTRTGHTFAGWHSDEDLQTPYAFGTPIGASDLTLYAKWTINNYRVSFDSNGGTEVTEQSVVFAQPAVEPVEPTRTGYTFAGWHSDESLQTPYAFGAPIGASDLTLYAKWDINSYTLAYDGNGSTGGSVPTATAYDYNSQVVVPGNAAGLAKTGHTFAGWNTAADGSGIAYAAGDTLTIETEGVTLYAQWTINSYSLAYDGNGSEAGSVPAGGVYDYGTVIPVPDNAGGLDKPGYTFAGWNAAADGSGIAYRPGDAFPMGDGALTLYAQWLSNNALLSFLSVDSFALSPAFSPSLLNYEVDLDYPDTGLSLSFSQADPTQIVTVTGAVYQSVAGAVYHYRADGLPTGTTPIRIGVTAQDGTFNAYTINVNREPGNNADLSGLELSAGSLSPVFAAGTTAYTVNVANGVSRLVVTAVSSDPLASVAVDGMPVGSGELGPEVDLSVGRNDIVIEVTARDGTKKTYTVAVFRASSSGGGGGGPTLPQPPGEISSDNGRITIPASQKGVVRLGDAITVTIPAGASGQQLNVTMTQQQGASLPSGSVALGPVVWITSDPAEPLLQPAAVSLAFDPAKLKAGQQPAVFAYDEAAGTWTKLEGGQVAGNRISVAVKRLLPVVVLAVDRSGEPGPETKPAAPLGDIAGHWAEAKIQEAVAAGIATGYADGTFKPNRTVTRAEFAVLLVKALKLQGTEASPEFADAAKIGAWAKESVTLAAQAGILKGYSDGTFRPGAEITRAEMAAMIANAMGGSPGLAAATGFADDKLIPQWAKAAVNAVQQAGLMQGKSSGAFDPLGKATRAEAVAVLLNLLEWQLPE